MAAHIREAHDLFAALRASKYAERSAGLARQYGVALGGGQ